MCPLYCFIRTKLLARNRMKYLDSFWKPAGLCHGHLHYEICFCDVICDLSEMNSADMRFFSLHRICIILRSLYFYRSSRWESTCEPVILAFKSKVKVILQGFHTIENIHKLYVYVFSCFIYIKCACLLFIKHQNLTWS